MSEALRPRPRADVLDTIGSVVGPALYLPVRAAVRHYFRRISVRHAERIPARGPLLVVANHPATLSEVFLLGTRLGRRFHFLAASFVFKPWIPRGVIARIGGAIPVYRRQDDPELTHRNEDVFRACHALFDRGGALVIFPEGESLTDRALLPLKTGAARLALGYDALPGRRGRLAVVPVGVYFSDRTKFQSDAVLTVGPAIEIGPYAAMADDHAAVRDLTSEMQRRLEALILNVPNEAVAHFVHDVERRYLQDLREERPGEHDLDLLQRVAACIHHFRTADPERVYTGWRRTTAYWRKLGALGLEDPAVQGGASLLRARRRALLLVVGAALGLVPAALGLLVNLPPFLLAGLLARAVTPDPILKSAGRMIAGILLFPLTYGLLAFGLARFAGWSWPPVVGVIALCFATGAFAVAYLRWLSARNEELRLAMLAANHRRLVARLRAERKALIRLFDEARADYLEATGGGTAPTG